MRKGISKNSKIALELFKQVLRIRIIEERIAHIYPGEEMRTPTHFSIGEEAVSVGICAALRKNDWVFNTHRCHAGYLAKGGDLRKMMAELFGRSTGACKGKSGSAHLSSPQHKMYAAPILGAMIPVAVGAALSISMDNKKDITVTFLGDAACEEGVFAESINFAVLKKLPIFFVCENNFYCTHTHIRYRQPSIPIYKRIGGLGIKACKVDGMNVLGVYKTAKNIVETIRKGKGPYFMECSTYRYLEHVGPNYDFYNPYRSRTEVESWIKKCPVRQMRRLLLKNKVITEKNIALIEKQINNEIDNAIEYARRSPWPKAKDLLRDVY